MIDIVGDSALLPPIQEQCPLGRESGAPRRGLVFGYGAAGPAELRRGLSVLGKALR